MSEYTRSNSINKLYTWFVTTKVPNIWYLVFGMFLAVSVAVGEISLFKATIEDMYSISLVFGILSLFLLWKAKKEVIQHDRIFAGRL